MLGGLALGFIWQFVFDIIFTKLLFGPEGRFHIEFMSYMTQDSVKALFALALLNTWQTAGYMMIIYIAGLNNIPRDFAAFLAEAKVSLWQILPLGPTGYGNSPYAARSSFAGNELLLSPEILAEAGLLTAEELADLRKVLAGPEEAAGPLPAGPPGDTGPLPAAPSRVDYGLLEKHKLPLLKKAARRFVEGGNDSAAFEAFCGAQKAWLDDYALFQILCENFRDARWHTVWDPPLARREEAALEKIRRERAGDMLGWKALQYFFERQWRDLKDHVNGLGIRIIGDIPIFAAPDSADSWTRIELFRTGPEGRYSVLSGVPPDYFSPTGQLWGNPVYDWDAMAASGYRWWIDRIRRLLSQVDLFRIDHFRGFDAYWAVPAGDSTAEHGVWEKGPGAAFFEALKKELGELPVLAEDLGFLTEGVKALRDGQGFPGMKVCQFGFEDMKKGVLDARHLFLPHNYSYHWAAYTGTHDNNTTAGWYAALGGADRKTVAAYLNCAAASGGLPAGRDIAWGMIRAVMASHARYAIVPMQDILGLGAEARMNTPATCNGENWSWRLSPDIKKLKNLAGDFAFLVSLYSRDG